MVPRAAIVSPVAPITALAVKKIRPDHRCTAGCFALNPRTNCSGPSTIKMIPGRTCSNVSAFSSAKCSSNAAAGFVAAFIALGFANTIARRVATATPINASNITATHKDLVIPRFVSILRPCNKYAHEP